MCVDAEPSWVDPLLLYLKEGKLPEGDSEAREIKRMAWRFVIVDGELYKRSFSQPLLKCVWPREADYILREITKGYVEAVLGPKPLARRLFGKGIIG